jgi:beta-glucoside operon transcriptional antiterminator
MPFSYDIKQLYPNEYKVGVMAVETIFRDLNIRLPDNESLALAMHFVNAQETTSITVTDSLFEEITGMVVDIIKDYFNIDIDQNDFSYNRFLMHLRYYLKRIETNEQVSNENNHVLMQAIKAESPDIHHCTIQIVNAIDDKLRTISTDDEVFYLMIYVKRIVTKSLKMEELKNG